jgi:phosphoenolpyruvate carboxykinase (ATP)
MKLRYTREMVTAVLNGSIENADFRHDDTFNVDIPSEVPNVPSEILDPRSTWEDKDAYDKQANKVAAMFEANCTKKYPDLDPAIRDAGPHAK